MSDNEQLPAPQPAAPKPAIHVGDRGVVLNTYDDMWRFATAAVKSGFAPKGIDTPEKALLALQVGLEAGLTPGRAILSVVPINGRPSWMGDAAKALVRTAGLLEPGTDFAFRYEGDGDNLRCIATAHKRGMALPVSDDFSVADAKRAGLWGKAGPWKDYPKRMLKYRAEGFLLRDHFSEALMGLRTEHEQQDIPDGGGPSFPEPREPVPDPLLEGATVPDSPVVDAEFRSSEEPPPIEDSPSSEAGAPASSPNEGKAAEPESDQAVGAGGAPVSESPAPAPEPSAPTVVPMNRKNGCAGCERHRRMLADPDVGHAADCRFRALPLPELPIAS